MAKKTQKATFTLTTLTIYIKLPKDKKNAHNIFTLKLQLQL